MQMDQPWTCFKATGQKKSALCWDNSSQLPTPQELHRLAGLPRAFEPVLAIYLLGACAKFQTTSFPLGMGQMIGGAAPPAGRGWKGFVLDRPIMARLCPPPACRTAHTKSRQLSLGDREPTVQLRQNRVESSHSDASWAVPGLEREPGDR